MIHLMIVCQKDAKIVTCPSIVINVDVTDQKIAIDHVKIVTEGLLIFLILSRLRLTYSENREKRRERDQSEDRDGKERRRRRRSVSRSSRAEKITVNNGQSFHAEMQLNSISRE